MSAREVRRKDSKAQMDSKVQALGETQDFGAEVEGLSPITRDLSPRDRLQFAKWILRGIFTFFVISVGVWLYQETNGEILLDIFRTGLLPIASFVIGDYFGSRDR